MRPLLDSCHCECRQLFAGVLSWWGSPREAAADWGRLTGLVALSTAAAWLAGGPLNKRLLQLLQELHLQVCGSAKQYWLLKPMRSDGWQDASGVDFRSC